MAGSVNKVILVGNLGKDPEVRNTQDGTKVVNLTLATSESWNDRASGEKKERTEWHRIVIFNDRTGDAVERFARKGSKIYVEGSLQTRKWDKDGVEVYTTEIVVGRFNGAVTFLDTKGGDGSASSSSGGDRPRERSAGPARSSPPRAGSKPQDDLDSEIPF